MVDMVREWRHEISDDGISKSTDLFQEEEIKVVVVVDSAAVVAAVTISIRVVEMRSEVDEDDFKVCLVAMSFNFYFSFTSLRLARMGKISHSTVCFFRVLLL